MLDAVDAGITDLSIVPVEDTGSVWAAWSAGEGPTRRVRLALIGHGSGPAGIAWSIRIPDAYRPAIRTMESWSYAGVPVLHFSYRLGAAYEAADIFGLSGQSVRKLGPVGGALIRFVRSGSRDILRVEDTADLQDAPHCHAWNDTTGRLATQPCP